MASNNSTGFSYQKPKWHYLQNINLLPGAPFTDMDYL